MSANAAESHGNKVGDWTRQASAATASTYSFYHADGMTRPEVAQSQSASFPPQVVETAQTHMI